MSKRIPNLRPTLDTINNLYDRLVCSGRDLYLIEIGGSYSKHLIALRGSCREENPDRSLVLSEEDVIQIRSILRNSAQVYRNKDPNLVKIRPYEGNPKIYMSVDALEAVLENQIFS